jgi:hypothetical protein
VGVEILSLGREAFIIDGTAINYIYLTDVILMISKYRQFTASYDKKIKAPAPPSF